ncbi:MAG: hypothetical protein R2706_03725 [Acidimicrobiales bacterium]
MSHQHFTVDVAAEEHLVRRRLNEAAERPEEVVGWFTTDDDVRATVTPSGDLWLLQVEGGTFKAKGSVELQRRVPGSSLVITLDLRGKGFFGLAGPLLALAGGRIEGQARSTLHREFGAP